MKHPDFTNPETFRDLERQAYDGTLGCSEFPPCEYQYFTELRNIYYAFKFEGLSKADAEAMKKKILHRYQQYQHEETLRMQFIREWNDNIRKSDILRSQISKSSDLVEKYTLAVQCIGAMTKDKVFTRTELEKLNQKEGDSE